MSVGSETSLASGLERSEIEAMLKAAEPLRLQALSASVNLTSGVFLTLIGRALLEGSFLWPVVAGVVAFSVWRLSQRLWRDLAIGALAPAIGARWGQASFESGWGAVDIETWFRDVFSEEGARFTAWQSYGRYREIDYRLSESTVWRRRRNNEPREVVHAMQVEVSVPTVFSGRVDLVPRSGFAGKIDDLIRKMSGSTEQRLEVDPAFDAVFDTVTSAGASADNLLTPGFRRAMLVLAARHPRMYLTAHFEHGWFSLRLPIAHLVFASASLTTPMPAMAGEADALWWDLTVPHRLIEALMGDHDGPLR